MTTRNEWMPIDTAPADEHVEVGIWDTWKDEWKWQTASGVVFETRLFGLLKQRQYLGHRYSHWRHLPPPPSDDASAQASHATRDDQRKAI